MKLLKLNQLHLGGDLKHRRLDRNGRYIGEYVVVLFILMKSAQAIDGHDQHAQNAVSQEDFENAKRALENGEGCQIYGLIEVNRVFLYKIGSRKFSCIEPCFWWNFKKTFHRDSIYNN